MIKLLNYCFLQELLSLVQNKSGMGSNATFRDIADLIPDAVKFEVRE